METEIQSTFTRNLGAVYLCIYDICNSDAV